MKFPTRKTANATERLGINYVRSIVEGANCIFHEIHRENDYGNDAFLELVDEEAVTGRMIALQVKSGPSYCNDSDCWIPASDRHRNYWRQGRVPVYGVVFDPSSALGYWVCISNRVRLSREGSVIRFAKTPLSRFDATNFVDIVLPLLLAKPVKLPLGRSLEFAQSEIPEMHSVGLRSLFYAHRSSTESWDSLERLLVEREVGTLDPIIAYFFAHVPGHGDIMWTPDSVLDSKVKQQLRDRMRSWGIAEVRSLLHLMGDSGVERGSVGQSVYAIVDLVIDNAPEKLLSLALDTNELSKIRENALLLLALVGQESAEPHLEVLVEDPSIGEAAAELLLHLHEYGFFAS